MTFVAFHQRARFSPRSQWMFSIHFLWNNFVEKTRKVLYCLTFLTYWKASFLHRRNESIIFALNLFSSDKNEKISRKASNVDLSESCGSLIESKKSEDEKPTNSSVRHDSSELFREHRVSQPNADERLLKNVRQRKSLLKSRRSISDDLICYVAVDEMKDDKKLVENQLKFPKLWFLFSVVKNLRSVFCFDLFQTSFVESRRRKYRFLHEPKTEKRFNRNSSRSPVRFDHNRRRNIPIDQFSK